MSWIERLHDAYIAQRRVRRLAERLAPLLPTNARVLDVGCGDGLLGLAVSERRPDVTLRGLEVELRPQTVIPAETFDGRRLPHPNKSFDALLMVDVLHHAKDAEALLREAVRVARTTLLIKDHTLEGRLAAPTLRFMDEIGNARHHVAQPHHYWPRDRWLATFRELGLELEYWQSKLDLYPWPLSVVFGRSLHFIAQLTVP